MDADSASGLIRDLGFPIFVSLYFMFMHYKFVQKILVQLERLTVNVEVIADLKGTNE
jgi:hypothetical protein